MSKWIYRSTDTERPCLRCNQLLPIESFPWTFRKDKHYRRRVCWECHGDSHPPRENAWTYRSNDTERMCQECQRVLPAEKFDLRKTRTKGENHIYRQRTCQYCVERQKPPRLSNRTPRMNVHGMWRCCGCKEYLSRDSYSKDVKRGTPLPYCRPCTAARVRIYYMKKSVDPQWAADMNERQKKHRHDRSMKAAKERTEIARVALEWLLAHGWTRRRIRLTIQISTKTIAKIERGETLRWRRVTDRLVTLWRREATKLEKPSYKSNYMMEAA